MNFRFLSATIFLFVSFASLQAADLEARTYSVSIDGKRSGEYRITMRTKDEGVLETTAETITQAPPGVSWRRTNYNGVETWKGGRLQHFEARCTDDGRRRRITASASGNQLRLLVNGQRSDVRGDVWTNTWWFLPEISTQTRDVAVMEVESGRVLAARLERLGIERLRVSGEPVECTHFRLRGEGLAAELWFDGRDRLVKFDATEDKHRTVMELIKLQR